MGNLFNKAKEAGSDATVKKNDKEIVEINDPMFHLNLSRLAEVNKEIDELAAESAVLGNEIKQRAIKEYGLLYDRTLKHPGSFIIKAVVKDLKPASLMFITADRYIKVDKVRAAELREKYGDEIVEEKTTYMMDTALVEKYGEVISNLIEGCKSIPEADKEKLISAVVSYEVKKGTIGDLKTRYASKPVEEVIEDVKPVFQMKNIKIEE